VVKLKNSAAEEVEVLLMVLYFLVVVCDGERCCSTRICKAGNFSLD